MGLRRRARQRARQRAQGERGLTLIELIIVIAILVMMLGLGVSGLENLASTELRVQTNKLAVAVRHAYNRSVATGLYMRMVLDVSTDSYWVEASPTPVFLVRPGDEKLIEDEKRAREREDEEGIQRIKTGPDFKMDPVISKITMEKGIVIDSVLIAGQQYPVTGGQATIHFFPNGYCEPAMIYTSDGDGDFRTLIINPLTGKVERKAGKADPARQFGEPDKVEEEGR